MPGMVSVSRLEKISHPPASALDLATIMHTLGDPIRLQIVRLLADGHRAWLRSAVHHPGPPCLHRSYHMRLLREAGVTRTRAEGTQRFTSLRRDDLDGRFPGLVDVLTR